RGAARGGGRTCRLVRGRGRARGLLRSGSGGGLGWTRGLGGLRRLRTLRSLVGPRPGGLLGDAVQVEIALRLQALAGGDADIALAREVHAAGIFGMLLIVALLSGDDVVAGAALAAIAEPVEPADDDADRDEADDDRGDQLADRG